MDKHMPAPKPVNALTHKVFIITGCCLWILSVILRNTDFQPYLIIGMAVSPLIIIIGGIFWLRYYKSIRNYDPLFVTLPHNVINSENGGNLQFRFLLRHFLVFFPSFILFCSLLLVLADSVIYNSDAFEKTKEYCQADKAIIDKTGSIKYYAIQSGSLSTENSSGEAQFSFLIFGDTGEVKATVILTETDSVWIIKNLSLK